MNESTCAEVREVLPLLALEALTGSDRTSVEEHVRSCEACAAELALARDLVGSRPVAPRGLADRIIVALESDRVVPITRPRAWWGLSAAAVAALALGIGVTSGPGAVVVEAPDFASELEEGDLWLSEDGLMAGAPALDELSDEALEQLLSELEAEADGGAA